MKKTYWYILLTYVIMQLTGLVGPILLFKLGVGSGAETPMETRAIAASTWALISFIGALIIILYLLREDMRTRRLADDRASAGSAFVWAIGGVFMAFFAQIIAANIERYLLGIDPGSENTQQIMGLVKAAPWFIIVTSIVGPILEEIIFRKIIFGALYQKYNFWIAGIISSLIFAVVHTDFKHILLYTAMGLTFAFLYVKTKRIIVPIFAHVAMNTFVVLIQIVFSDKIEEMMKKAEEMQLIIWRLIS